MASAPTDNMELFNALKKRPYIAWPTVFLLLACHTVIFSSWALVLMDKMPLWAGCVANSIAMYFLFSPIHDAIHHAMSTNDKINQFFVYLILLPIVPFSDGQMLRVGHMMHHRFANEPEKDPDHFTMTAPLPALWIWFFWDFNYLIYYLRNKEMFAKMYVGHPLRDTIMVWTIAFAVGWFYPMEVIFLWLIPSRMMAWSIALVFMYLPHYPHDIAHNDQPYQATHMRRGLDWLLTPLMAWQNYHLVHHLYPTVPFYRYRRLWNARQAFHESHNPSTVDALALEPDRLKNQVSSA